MNWNFLHLPSYITKRNFSLLISTVAVILAISSHTKRVINARENIEIVLFFVSIVVGVGLGVHLSSIGY